MPSFGVAGALFSVLSAHRPNRRTSSTAMRMGLPPRLAFNRSTLVELGSSPAVVTASDRLPRHRAWTARPWPGLALGDSSSSVAAGPEPRRSRCLWQARNALAGPHRSRWEGSFRLPGPATSLSLRLLLGERSARLPVAPRGARAPRRSRTRLMVLLPAGRAAGEVGSRPALVGHDHVGAARPPRATGQAREITGVVPSCRTDSCRPSRAAVRRVLSWARGSPLVLLLGAKHASSCSRSPAPSLAIPAETLASDAGSTNARRASHLRPSESAP